MVCNCLHRYYNFYLYLHENVLYNRYVSSYIMKGNPMNIYDISEIAGVSIATVSRVINGNAKVSPKTRDKVLKTMDDWGYTPNAFARGLGLNSMKTIGIMCADSSDPFMAKAIFYLERSLRQNNYDVLLCCTGYALSDKNNYLKLLLSKRIDAIILVGSNFVEAATADNDYIRKAAEKVPVMILNGALSGSNIYATVSDDYTGVHEATRRLTNKGSKHIHYLYNAHSYSGNHKRTGFIDAMADQGLIQEQLLAMTHYIDGGIQEARSALNALAQEGIVIEGIIAADDTLAVGALKFAKDKHLSVPDDLAIIGYNNSIIATCCEPELTSIDNNVEALSKACIDNLMTVIAGNQVPSQTIYPAKLIERGTTL